MFNQHDISRNAFMLHGPLARCGYDWWWHSFTAQDAETGEDKPFFIEFFVCNPALAEDKPVFGQLPANKKVGKRPSYLMVKGGFWGEDHAQLHKFFSLKETRIKRKAPYKIKAGDCYASETRLKGSISISEEEVKLHPEWMCDAGSMSFDLKLDKQIAFNVGYGASRAFREAEAFAMYWHAEGMKTLYSGTVICNGRKYIVTPEKSYGYADKNWGRDFTSPWVWLSSNCLVSKKTGKQLHNSVFDIGGGRPKVYFVPIDRKLLGALYYEGREYDFNFSKLNLKVKTEFSFDEQDDIVIWHVRQENYKAVMETEIMCKKKDMLLINYEAPDGRKRHNRLWNGGNGWGTVKIYEKTEGRLKLIDEIEATHVGCEYGEYC
ncbi:MAG: tocopherol cyclase family protein [Lachnospiraceae bacterium]|nr:tocopherol cyclase family protein [Lachnospiraceae bacterium]